MNTADVLKSCRALPGVSVREREDCTELRLSGPDGEGRMRFYPALPGLTLAHIAVRAPSWPVPAFSGPPEASGPLIINYCTRGRCDLVLNDSRSIFLTPGRVALTEKFARADYLYPGRVYEGVELFIDPDAAAGGCALLGAFGVDLPALREKFCPGGATFIAKLPLPEHLSARLLADPDSGPAARAGLKTAVIDLLLHLQHGWTDPEPERLVYYTRSQVEMARQIEAAIARDLSRAHTAREFAARFGVSESSIKNYFSGVFGQSIAQYTARRRMELAAGLLAATRLSVIDIAARAGYESQSKFSAAFRRTYSCTPSEYRRRSALAERQG